jgi:hypothetical protein
MDTGAVRLRDVSVVYGSSLNLLEILTDVLMMHALAVTVRMNREGAASCRVPIDIQGMPIHGWIVVEIVVASVVKLMLVVCFFKLVGIHRNNLALGCLMLVNSVACRVVTLLVHEAVDIKVVLRDYFFEKLGVLFL